MTEAIYNFVPIPDESRPANDAFQQISDALYQTQSEQVLQAGAGWDGMFTDTTRPYALTVTPLTIAWDVSMSDRFGSVAADPANDRMVYGIGVYTTIIAGTVIIPSPTGQVRTVVIDIYDTVAAEVVMSGSFTVEKSVEQASVSTAFVTPIDDTNAYQMRISSADNFTVNLADWKWQAFDISPLGYVPAPAVPAIQERLIEVTAEQTGLGFYGGMARDINSGIAPLQAVTTPVPVGGFDTIKASRTVINESLANASIEVDSDGMWLVDFTLNGMVGLNRRYLFIVWLNGARTECGAVVDTSNQTNEFCARASTLLSLATGDVLQLQVESTNGPSDWETEFGSFTATKVGEL